MSCGGLYVGNGRHRHLAVDDDFSRGNNSTSLNGGQAWNGVGTWGWENLSLAAPAMNISISSNSAGPNTTTNGRSIALRSQRPLETDDVAVRFRIASGINVRRSGVLFRAERLGVNSVGQWIGLLVNNSNALLCRGSGRPAVGDGNISTLQTSGASTGGANNQWWEVQARGDNIKVFRADNPTPVIDYTGALANVLYTGGEGSIPRLFGMIFERSSSSNSFRINAIAARELYPVA